jgi:hypothetical protein
MQFQDIFVQFLQRISYLGFWLIPSEQSDNNSEHEPVCGPSLDDLTQISVSCVSHCQCQILEKRTSENHDPEI